MKSRSDSWNIRARIVGYARSKVVIVVRKPIFIRYIKQFNNLQLTPEAGFAQLRRDGGQVVAVDSAESYAVLLG